MKAKEFVRSKYPESQQYPMIDNYRKQTSYVIIKASGSMDIFTNEGAKTASKAWVNAKKEILKDEI